MGAPSAALDSTFGTACRRILAKFHGFPPFIIWKWCRKLVSLAFHQSLCTIVSRDAVPAKDEALIIQTTLRFTTPACPTVMTCLTELGRDSQIASLAFSAISGQSSAGRSHPQSQCLRYAAETLRYVTFFQLSCGKKFRTPTISWCRLGIPTLSRIHPSRESNRSVRPIGPHAVIVHHVEEIRNAVPRFHYAYSETAGLTCLTQIGMGSSWSSTSHESYSDCLKSTKIVHDRAEDSRSVINSPVRRYLVKFL